MNRLIPHPILSAALLLMWLMLTAFSLGHLILGTAVALVAGRAMATLEPASVHLRRWHRIPRFAALVIADIVRSNIAVARLILTGDRGGTRVSGFIEMQLQLTDRTALALLAVIITATPGTAWIEYDPVRQLLLIHLYDMTGEAELRRLVHDVYEPLLLEIFE